MAGAQPPIPADASTSATTTGIRLTAYWRSFGRSGSRAIGFRALSGADRPAAGRPPPAPTGSRPGSNAAGARQSHASAGHFDARARKGEPTKPTLKPELALAFAPSSLTACSQATPPNDPTASTRANASAT